MKQEFYIGELKGLLDTDYYKGGIELTDTNGYKIKISREDVEKLNRVCNLIPYREDVIYYLRENDMNERALSEPYVEALTRNYEEIRHNNEGYETITWQDCLDQAFNDVDYEQFVLKDTIKKETGGKKR